MFWKKAEATDFERAVDAYYKCCKRKRVEPIKPSAQYSEICDGHIILRDRFMLIARIFFVSSERQRSSKKEISPSGSYARRLQ